MIYGQLRKFNDKTIIKELQEYAAAFIDDMNNDEDDGVDGSESHVVIKTK
jgi:hypothetical protein